MKVSAAGRKFIEGHEGRRLRTYDDGYGNPTIGIGHKLKSFADCPDGLTDEQCEAIFAEDCRHCADAINALSARTTLAQNQFDALADFVFNVGSPRFKNCQVGIELHKGNVDTVAIYFFFWTKASGIRSKALLARRHACARLYWFGIYQPGY